MSLFQNVLRSFDSLAGGKRRSPKAATIQGERVRGRRLGGFERLKARQMLSATEPFVIVNNSPYPASDISIALYAQDFSTQAPFYYFNSTGAAADKHAAGRTWRPKPCCRPSRWPASRRETSMS